MEMDQAWTESLQQKLKSAWKPLDWPPTYHGTL